MSGVLKISEAASLAIHTTALIVNNSNELMNTKYIAKTLQISEAHLSKVMQRLVKAGILHSTRGPKGGFKLIKNPNELTLLEIYENIDGPIYIENCIMKSTQCTASSCVMGNILAKLNRDLKHYLQNTKISDLKNIFKTK